MDPQRPDVLRHAPGVNAARGAANEQPGCQRGSTTRLGAAAKVNTGTWPHTSAAASVNCAGENEAQLCSTTRAATADCLPEIRANSMTAATR